MQPEQLKSLRKRLGLTQAKLASSLNVATNTVARWERGVMTIPDSAAVKLERMAEAGPSGTTVTRSDGAVLDPHHRAILEGLKVRLDPELFEMCATELLKEDWPGLVSVRGGGDDGFDGAISDNETNKPFPLVTTTSKDLVRNLKSNLEQAKKKGWEIERAIFATSRRITPSMRKKLHKSASELDITLIQTYDQDWFAFRLYRESDWCKRLLGVTGRPSALSVFPITSRPLIGDQVLGRDKELKWLLEQKNDCLMVGGPGSGKTFLLRALALEGRALFLIDPDRENLANAIRDQSPPAIIIDDAQVDPNLVAKLIQVRREIKADFSIIAISWPSGKTEVARILNISSDDILELDLIHADTMIEIIQSVGIKGPNELLRIIREQAEGRPGLAVTLADLCRKGDIRRVVSGETLVEQITSQLDSYIKVDTARILAPFALGGDAGMKQEIVADYLGMSRYDLSSALARLAEAGIVKELYNGAISVSPEQMRFALVRRLFFGGPGSLDFSLLIEKVESINNALYTLIGARARGAIISDLEERLEKLSDVSLWSVYASLGVPETQYIVDKHPDLILDIAEPALIFAPETTIPMLLDIACDDNRPLNSTPDHPMRKLQDWATGAHPSQEDVLARRSTLLSCSKSWWGKTGRTNIAVKAMCIALKPGFEYTSTDPGVGRSVTFTFGRLLDSDLKKIAALWPVVLQVLSEANDIPWGELFQLVHEWLTPDPRIDTPEDTRQYMDQVGSRMLNGLASISKAHAGIQHKIYEFSEENKFQVEVTLDPNFEILYPVERINRDEEEDSQAKAAKDLASDWTSRSVGEITASLKYIEREAYLAGISYPRLTPIVCDYLAKADAQPITTANEFIKEGLPADLLEYFVSKSVNNRITGWEDLVNKCLEEDSYRWVGISVLLTDSEPPQDILKTALGYAVNMGHLIEIPCLRGEVSENTLHVLLTHNDPRIAVPAAIGHWQANRKNRTDLTLSDAWRRAILKSLDDNSMARNDEYWIGEILKKDSELACAWLKKLLAEKRTYLSYGVNETAKRAINALDKTQRRTILESINPEFRSNGLVGLLIDDDMELYADMLGMENLERYHLDPLAGAPDTVWKKKALLALDAGYLPEDIARAVLGNSWTISGPVSVYWQGWIDAFEPLCHDTDARIARIGEFGCEMSRKNQERALKREHEEAIHGI